MTAEPARGLRTTEEFMEAARNRPGLIDNLKAGDLDAMVEFFELADGVKVTITANHENGKP